MITTKGDGQFPVLDMPPDYFCDRLIHARYQPWILEDTDGWVIHDFDVLELVVTVKFNFPAQTGELVNKAGFNEMDGAFVNA